MMRAMRRPLLLALLMIASIALRAYVPVRVFDTSRRQFSDFEMMLADIVAADVVFVGEQHDDPNTHQLELSLLEGIARRHPRAVVIALEMFERDVQEPLDHFQMGHMDEKEFLSASRPWPNYATDYKPLVDFAVKQNWPIVASNVPREIAADVSKRGLDALKDRPADQTRWYASDVPCVLDGEYFKRFAEAMGEHPQKGAESPNVARYFQAQCVKDATMSESIARAYAIGAGAGTRPLVVQFNGAFHTDFGLGTADRTRRQMPGKRIAVLSILPVDELDRVSPDKTDRKRADYLIYTIGKGK
jgi:uncharacterized iron-regulated protein